MLESSISEVTFSLELLEAIEELDSSEEQETSLELNESPFPSSSSELLEEGFSEELEFASFTLEEDFLESLSSSESPFTLEELFPLSL